MSYPIVEVLLPGPSKRRPGPKINQVRFLVAHDTGNPDSTARQNVMYYARTVEKESASAHIFVDDREIIECIPTGLSWRPAEKAWHVHYDRPEDNRLFGDDANDVAIGVEYCFGSGIDVATAYARYVWTLAELCRVHNLDPWTKIAGHFQLDPTRRSDPVNALSRQGKTFEQLVADVAVERLAVSVQGVTQTTTTSLRLRASPGAVNIPIRKTMAPDTVLVPTRSIQRPDGTTWFGNAEGWWWGGGVKAA